MFTTHSRKLPALFQPQSSLHARPGSYEQPYHLWDLFGAYAATVDADAGRFQKAGTSFQKRRFWVTGQFHISR